MIDYRRLGEVSPKQHTVFEVDKQMVAEHVFTKDGFNDLYSILYQKRAPTHEVKAEIYSHANEAFPLPSAAAQNPEPQLMRRHVMTQKIEQAQTPLLSRKTLFYNQDCSVGICKPNKEDEMFFVNGDCDECYFIAEGTGILQSIFGSVSYKKGDYLFIPKGVPYRFTFKDKQNWMIVEGRKEFGIPLEYKHKRGQIKLDAPYNHRDFRSPAELVDWKKVGNPAIVVKRYEKLTKHEYTDWPYQVIGWDGWVYPFAFSVYDYQPKTSNVHLPPSIHMVFSATGFVMMNFVPRIVDYHEKAIPCPYPHSSVDCDEILFYVDGNFTSRKSVGQYSMSYHPGGIPHGPHPEKYEESVGTKRTDELAIMVDTFAPLCMAPAAREFEDKAYHASWNTKQFL